MLVHVSANEIQVGSTLERHWVTLSVNVRVAIQNASSLVDLPDGQFKTQATQLIKDDSSWKAIMLEAFLECLREECFLSKPSRLTSGFAFLSLPAAFFFWQSYRTSKARFYECVVKGSEPFHDGDMMTYTGLDWSQSSRRLKIDIQRRCEKYWIGESMGGNAPLWERISPGLSVTKEITSESWASALLHNLSVTNDTLHCRGGQVEKKAADEYQLFQRQSNALSDPPLL